MRILHEKRGERADIHSPGELAARVDNAWSGPRVWLVGKAGRCLWHRRIFVDGNNDGTPTFIALNWGYNPILVALANGFFLVVDLIFFAANSTKLFEGGWFPLLLAGIVVFLMFTWRTGQRLIEQARSHLRQGEAEFVRSIAADRPVRLPGTAAFLPLQPAVFP